MSKIERPTSLAEVVTARLRREIVEGEFELGQALSESKIAARYDVSRTPVREAFACLGLEGLVRTEPQYGTFVFTMDREQFAQISETRSILETAALRLAIEREGAGLTREWRRITASMTSAIEDDDARQYSRADGEFHQILFDLAANPFLAMSRQSFAAKMAALRNRLGTQPEHMAKSYKEHLLLLDFIERGDTDEAVHLLEGHIRHKGESFWAGETKVAPKSRWERISELAE